MNRTKIWMHSFIRSEPQDLYNLLNLTLFNYSLIKISKIHGAVSIRKYMPKIISYIAKGIAATIKKGLLKWLAEENRNIFLEIDISLSSTTRGSAYVLLILCADFERITLVRFYFPSIRGKPRRDYKLND